MGTAYTAFSDPARTLRDYLIGALPAELTTLNGLRAATIKSTLGSFTVPSNAKLPVSAQGAATTLISLTAGTRTAAQIVSDINGAGVANLTASVDAQSRVSIASTVNPTTGVSAVTLGADATGGNLALGFPDGGMSDRRQPLVSPTRAEFFAYDPPAAQARLGANRQNGVGSAMWMFVGEQAKLNAKGPKSFEHDVRLTIEIADTAEAVDELHERMRFYARALDEAVANDRHLGTLIQGNSAGVVYSEVSQTLNPKVMTLRTGGGAPIATTRLQILMRVFDSN